MAVRLGEWIRVTGWGWVGMSHSERGWRWVRVRDSASRRRAGRRWARWGGRRRWVRGSRRPVW